MPSHPFRLASFALFNGEQLWTSLNRPQSLAWFSVQAAAFTPASVEVVQMDGVLMCQKEHTNGT